jgi:hypothetical protein
MFSLLAAVACLSLGVGCSQNSNIVRGQAPEGALTPQPAPQFYQGNPGYGDNCEYDDCDYCHGRGCRHCKCRPYCVPGDLVYPPPGDAPAIVQYPYYTNKGPDCFFHQQ